MFITDHKILELRDYLKEIGIIGTKDDFDKEIGLQKSNIALIRNQEKNKSKQSYHFTVEHIIKICAAYNVNPSWIYGYETKVFRPTAQKLHKIS